MREKKTPSKSKTRVAREIDKLVKDWSAEERFYNRSRLIRRRIDSWMLENLGTVFETVSAICDECGNYSRCSSITAYRWVHQFSAANGKYIIEHQEEGYNPKDIAEVLPKGYIIRKREK